MSRSKRIGYSLIPALVLFGTAEIALRVIGIPAEKYATQRFEFPPEDLYGTAFRRDDHRFWRLINNYDGPWRLYRAPQADAPDVRGTGLDRPLEYPNADYFETVTWEVNEDGFRGRRHDPQKRIILFLGSSVTFGWGVRADDCFVGLVRQKLAEHGYDDWDVVNAGVPGYTSHQCLTYLREIQQQVHPQIVVLECGLNDGVWAPGLSDRDISMAANKPWAERLVRRSNLLLAVAYAIHRGKRHETDTAQADGRERFYRTKTNMPGRSRVSRADFERNVQAVEDLAERRDARTFFLFPGLYNEDGAGKLVKAVRFSHANEIDIVAAMKARPDRDLPEYFLPYDAVHLSVKGHRFAAELIWQRLDREGVLQH